MAPLTWKNIEAPNFSSSADIYRGVGQNFSQAFSGLGDALSGFRDVQRNEASAPAISLLAQINDEASAAAAREQIAKTIDPRNMTTGLQEALLGANRKGLDMYRDRTSTALDVAEDGRTAVTFERTNRLEDQLGAMARPYAESLEQSFNGARSDATDYLMQRATGGGQRPDSFTGMQPEFSGALANMLQAAPPEIAEELRIGSGYRSPERQAEIISESMGKYGFSRDDAAAWQADVSAMGSVAAGQKWADRLSSSGLRKNIGLPGGSNHQKGSAADFSYAADTAKEWAQANAGQFGLAFPMGHEPWHVELANARAGGDAALPNGNTGGIRLSEYLPKEGNLISPEIMGTMMENLYDENRDVITDRRADRTNAREEQKIADAAIAERVAQETITSINDPERAAAVIMKDERLTAPQKTAAVAYIQGADVGALTALPATAGNGLSDKTAQAMQDAELQAKELELDFQLELDNDPAQRIWSNAKSAYGGSEPAVQLAEQFGLGEDSKGRLTQSINQVADALGMPPGVAASLLVETMERGGIAPDAWFGGWIDGDISEVRTKVSEAIELGKALGLPDEAGVIERKANKIEQRRSAVSNLQSQAAVLSQQLQRATANGRPKAELEALDAQIFALHQEILGIQTSGDVRRKDERIAEDTIKAIRDNPGALSEPTPATPSGPPIAGPSGWGSGPRISGRGTGELTMSPEFMDLLGQLRMVPGTGSARP